MLGAMRLLRSELRLLTGRFVVATKNDGETVEGKLTNHTHKAVWITEYQPQALDIEHFIRADSLESIVVCPRCGEANENDFQQSPPYGPNHLGSEHCRSGSIAAGGHRSHCSCSTCY